MAVNYEEKCFMEQAPGRNQNWKGAVILNCVRHAFRKV